MNRTINANTLPTATATGNARWLLLALALASAAAALPSTANARATLTNPKVLGTCTLPTVGPLPMCATGTMRPTDVGVNKPLTRKFIFAAFCPYDDKRRLGKVLFRNSDDGSSKSFTVVPGVAAARSTRWLTQNQTYSAALLCPVVGAGGKLTVR